MVRWVEGLLALLAAFMAEAAKSAHSSSPVAMASMMYCTPRPHLIDVTDQDGPQTK